MKSRLMVLRNVYEPEELYDKSLTTERARAQTRLRWWELV